MELKMEGPVEFANKVKDTYDYLTGKRTHNLSGLNDATDEEIRSCPELDKFIKFFKTAKGEVDVQIDSSGKNFLVKFSATAVPKNLADQIKPGGKYYDMISHYDKSSKSVEMIFNADKKESVMQPTPVPYKLELKTEDVDEESEYTLVDRKYVNDSDGFRTEYSWYMDFDGNSVFILGDSDFYTPEDGSFDHEEEDPEVAQEWFDSYNGFDDDWLDEDSMFEHLIETAGLDTSVLVRKINDDGVDSIEMDINGRIYSFTMKEESPYTIDQMFHKVTKMRGYSEGRALAFMKKNMIGKRVESLVVEGKNPFKDKHICDGCGNPLSQCTCKVQEEEEVEEALTESTESDLFYVGKEVLCDSKGNISVKCLDLDPGPDGKYFIKQLGHVDDPSACKEARLLLDNPQFEIERNVRNELISTFGLEDYGFKIEESLTEAVTTETYKTIKIELNDPDSQLENLIKCIKASSDPGHTFPVTVDGDESKVFTMDGDGSFRITSIEVKDEVEDVEVKEESFYSPKTRKISIDDLKAFYNSSTVLKSEYPNFFAWYDAMIKAGKYSTEDIVSSSSTQPSSVGQHKKGSLDMFPGSEDNEGDLT